MMSATQTSPQLRKQILKRNRFEKKTINYNCQNIFNPFLYRQWGPGSPKACICPPHRSSLANHRLSLLEFVLDEQSGLMACSVMSQPSFLVSMAVVRIHGWSKICSRVGLSEGLKQRHHLMSCWHSVEIFLRKNKHPWRISSSCSNGMSPQTMSYRSTPSDHTVADLPWYLWKCIHSGGLYTLVPSKSV